MIDQKQKVSVIIAAFNAAAWIGATLESLLAQTWKNIEIIVVNDGSVDGTHEILNVYKSRGIIVFNQENKGQDIAFNNGFRESSGQYIKFMDADDLVNPVMIELQMKILDGSNAYIAYSEWGRFFNDNPSTADFTYLEYWKDADPVDFLTARPAGVMLQCGTMLLPRVIIEKVGPWNETLVIFNDTEYYTRAILASNGIRFTPGAKLYYRSGRADSISALRTRKSFESSFRAFSLIGEHMMQMEPSTRVKNLIANMFEHRYHEMYPEFPDLGKRFQDMVSRYGGATCLPATSQLYKLSSKLFGWKRTKSWHAKISRLVNPKLSHS